jgi:hypothetical protein
MSFSAGPMENENTTAFVVKKESEGNKRRTNLVRKLK